MVVVVVGLLLKKYFFENSVASCQFLVPGSSCLVFSVLLKRRPLALNLGLAIADRALLMRG